MLAVDLGTGGPKVALVSATGRIAAHAFEAVGITLLPGGGAEQDPHRWWSAVVCSARKALSDGGVAPDHVVGVGCTAQWSGTVAVGGDGEPLGNAVSWMDSRGATAVRRQVRGPVNVLGYAPDKAVKWIRRSGGIPSLSGKDPVGHILFLREQRPDVYREARVFLEPVDYLNLRLTGLARASYDSITLHWVTDNRRIGRVAYDPLLVAMAGLDRATLPELVPTDSVLGGLTDDAAGELGLLPGTTVVAGTGDLHSAAVGSGAVEDFAGHLYIGTSSWISCHVPFKKTVVQDNIASIPSGIPGKYLVADEHETGGACLTWLRDCLLYPDDGLGLAGPGRGEMGRGAIGRGAIGRGEMGRGEMGRGATGLDEPDGAGPDGGRREVPEDAFARMNAAAAGVPAGANGVLFTPWLNGERSPVDDHTIRAGFHNMSLSTTRADLVRAVFEGVALNSRWLLGAVEKFAGRRFESLAFVGGGASSDLWAQIHADVTGRAIRQVADPVLANVRGAGLLALLSLGRVRLADIPSMVEIRAQYEPDPATSNMYRETAAELVNLYKQTKGIHRRLNRRRLGGGS